MTKRDLESSLESCSVLSQEKQHHRFRPKHTAFPRSYRNNSVLHHAMKLDKKSSNVEYRLLCTLSTELISLQENQHHDRGHLFSAGCWGSWSLSLYRIYQVSTQGFHTQKSQLRTTWTPFPDSPLTTEGLQKTNSYPSYEMSESRCVGLAWTLKSNQRTVFLLISRILIAKVPPKRRGNRSPSRYPFSSRDLLLQKSWRLH